VALIGDETGRVLGVGRAGPSNLSDAPSDRVKFTEAVGQAIGAAAAAAGLDPASIAFECACLGFSGGSEGKRPLLRDILRAERLSLTHDADIALYGALAGEAGMVVIAGTGSIAYGRNSQGKTARAGGWGYLFGDEGGAFDIARRALRAVLRFEEGWGPGTSLRADLLAATGARDAHHLMHLFYSPEYPRDRIAGFARLVDSQASKGDVVALQILDDAAGELAALVFAIRSHIFPATGQVPVSYSGGTFQSAALLRGFRERVESGGVCTLIPPIHGPAAGALLAAYRDSGLAVALTSLPKEKIDAT
jgi:N-acetylglucosamine kinase-like BadF-type ATPase